VSSVAMVELERAYLASPTPMSILCLASVSIANLSLCLMEPHVRVEIWIDLLALCAGECSASCLRRLYPWR
jgi:hypothetical protein